MPFIKKTDSWSDLTIFLIWFISSLENISVVVRKAKSEERRAKSEGQRPDSNIYLWIDASVPDAAAIYPNGIKTLLANVLSTFPIKGNPVFSNGSKSLPRNPSDCLILYNWWIICKVVMKIWNYSIINNNLCGKLFSSLNHQ